MNIAFISDIHSNHLALQAVLNDIKTRKIETVYCLGDIVGYHTFPNETITLLQQSNVQAILGNHDADVLAKRFNPEKEFDIFKWTFETLTEENKNYLSSLPLHRIIDVGGWKLHLCHGSPESIELYCHEDSSYTEQVVANLSEDILLCGHTHLPYFKQINTKYMVNSGSVGKPKIGTPNATYHILDLTKDRICSEIVEVEYDFETVACHVETEGFKKYADHLRTGKVS